MVKHIRGQLLLGPNPHYC